ncbi:MAG TPA: hypothetical protein DDZ51_29450 [Planctomycetaceae bacterium]|nr:hypothetical protein [Planctomycetaceae bacterium]
MTQIHIAKNGQQFGPYDDENVARGLQSGEFAADDLCWTQGQSEWKPIRVVLPHLCSAMPPPIPKMPSGSPQFSGTSKKTEFSDLFWLIFVGLTVITTFLSLVADFASIETEDAGGVAFLLSSPIFITTIVAMVWLHYRLWRNLPEQYRATTPGKAVGFMFIPIFNFYWVFISYPKLSEGIYNWSSDLGRSPPFDTRGLAMANAVLFVVSLTVGLLPILGSLIGIASTVVLLMYYYHVLSAQKQLVQITQGNE